MKKEFKKNIEVHDLTNDEFITLRDAVVTVSEYFDTGYSLHYWHDDDGLYSGELDLFFYGE